MNVIWKITYKKLEVKYMKIYYNIVYFSREIFRGMS